MISKNLPTINIIGAGLVGQTLAIRIAMVNCGTILNILNSTYKSSCAAAKKITQGRAIKNIEEIHPADFVFITTPDDKIESICSNLCAKKLLKADSIVIHCSGTQPLDSLSAARHADCHIARVHPIKHISSVDDAIATFNDTYCVFEGDNHAAAPIFDLFTKIGAQALRINHQSDCLYHTACVFATTFPQILLSATSILYEACGINRENALKLSNDLIMNSLVLKSSMVDYIDFIEGPIKRADTTTIRKNMASIKNTDITAIYKALTNFGVSLTNHPGIIKKHLLEAIKSNKTI